MPFGQYIKNLRNFKVLRRLRVKLAGDVVHLKPRGLARGNVLISYTLLPFVAKEHILDGHTNRWECREIVNIFLERGYSVDVIDSTNTHFVPKKKYAYFLDVHSNMERLAPLLNSDCVKILHATTSEWQFQNDAEQKRLHDLQKRRGILLSPKRNLPSSHSVEYADFISLLGNEVTASTYTSAQEKITLIPLSTTHTYSAPEEKDFSAARKNFIWLGGSGAVHKGLDLVLEAFAQMPEYRLVVYGKVANEKDFMQVYQRELNETHNIKLAGLVDPGGEEFENMRNSSVALVYPSCSEGQSGSVVVSMHAGLIPIVSSRAGVNVGDFGITLKDNTVAEIQSAVRFVATLPEKDLLERAVRSWDYARKHHTKETFAKAYRTFIDKIEGRKVSDSHDSTR